MSTFAVNKDLIRQKLNEIKQKTQKVDTSKVILKLEEGKKITLRVVPYPHFQEYQKGLLFPEVYIHYGVGGRSFQCLQKNFGEECPICEYVEGLLPHARRNRELYRHVKDVSARVQPYAAVLVRGVTDDDGGPYVRLWRLNNTVYTQLMEYAVSDDYGNFYDVKNGLDIDVVYERSPGKAFPDTRISMRRRETPLAHTEEDIRDVLSRVPNISEVFRKPTHEEINKALSSMIEERNDQSDAVDNSTTDIGIEYASTENKSKDVVENDDNVRKNIKELEGLLNKIRSKTQNQS